MQTRLGLTGSQYATLRQHLFPGDGLEAVALLLCGRGRGAEREQLLGRRVVLIPHDRSSCRLPDKVEWSVEEFLLPLVEEMERDDLGVVVVHSHPKGGRFFSRADDQGDRSLFPSVHSWFDQPGAHGAAVMLPDGDVIARYVEPDGSFRPVDVVAVAGDDLKFFRPARTDVVPEHARRLVQTFGEGTYQLLKSLKVAVVGCSGTGSIMVELLYRNCIGHLVLVDDDRVEEKNLNRIINSKARHAAAETFKVHALAEAIREAGLGTQVTAIPMRIYDAAAVRAVAECDVIIGCMDSVEGRYILNSLASAYCLPYFDTGVEIEPDGRGGIDQAVADAHYIQPEGSSLLSRGVCTPEALAAESQRRLNPAFYEQQRQAGYLAAVLEDRPAVMPLNMVASNGVMIDLLARIHGFRLDANSEFSRQRWSLTHGYYEKGGDGTACTVMSNFVGIGDRWSPSC